MAQDQSKNNKEFTKRGHETNDLFTEWAAPADTVEAFGGNPNKADDRQWKKKDPPGAKSHQ